MAIWTIGAVFATTLAAGCASAIRTSAPRSAHRSSRPPVVFYPAEVVKPGRLNPSQLKDGAALLSGNRIAFVTSGSSNCYWTPTRLTILTSHKVRIDMRMAEHGSMCLANLVGFPIAVRYGWGLVDVHKPVTVRLAYAIHYCCGEGTKHWQRTLVAPPISTG